MIQEFVSNLMGRLCPATPETWLGDAGCALAAEGTAAAVPLVLAAFVTVALLATGFQRLRQRNLRGGDAFLYSGAPPASVRPVRDRPIPATDDPPSVSPADAPLSADVDATDPGATDRAVPVQRAPVQRGANGADRQNPTESTALPPEWTLQLLPGRMVIEGGDGSDRPREVRFVRLPGTPPEISFGRDEGPPHRHIQLSSSTVSRQHARIRFDGARWRITNESATNPTRINGDPLGGSAGEALLEDGDRIEMGEVVLLFRQETPRDRLPLRSSWYTDRGRRSSNQDAVAIRTLPDGREVTVVCDGMGGHSAGADASHLALEAFMTRLEEGGSLEEAVVAANEAVRSAAAADPSREGMGTTIVALLRDGEQYEVVNVGDSRAYRIDGTGIRQITTDHSFVAEVVKDGRMSRDEAERSPWRSAITRHLGAADEVEVDMFGPFSVQEDHMVILCSDGVHGVLSDAALESLARDVGNVGDLAREIGEAVLRTGGDDNVTASAIRFGTGLAAASRAAAGD